MPQMDPLKAIDKLAEVALESWDIKELRRHLEEIRGVVKNAIPEKKKAKEL